MGTPGWQWPIATTSYLLCIPAKKHVRRFLHLKKPFRLLYFPLVLSSITMLKQVFLTSFFDGQKILQVMALSQNSFDEWRLIPLPPDLRKSTIIVIFFFLTFVALIETAAV